MRLEHTDLKKLGRLQIIASGFCAAAVTLAESFNERLQDVQRRLDEYFNAELPDALTSDLKALDAIAKKRRSDKLALLQEIVLLTADRLEVGKQIREQLEQEIQRTAAEQRRVIEKTTADLHKAGLTEGIQAALSKIPAVNEAVENHTHAKRCLPDLMGGGIGANMDSHAIQQFGDDLRQRLVAWVGELAGIEAAPTEPEELRPRQPKVGLRELGNRGSDEPADEERGGRYLRNTAGPTVAAR